jgi:hypothetical protein
MMEQEDAFPQIPPDSSLASKLKSPGTHSGLISLGFGIHSPDSQVKGENVHTHNFSAVVHVLCTVM